tara:strand:- start:163 stop:537 length:375 start_codon:yes stop_codon:yes gene_type:complete
MSEVLKSFASTVEKFFPLPYGLRQWVGQRFTAVLMVLYTLFFTGKFFLSGPMGFSEWQNLFAPIWMKLWTLAFMVSLFYHAWVGVRDIFMDYIGLLVVRLVLQSIVIIVLVAYTFWVIDILWSY